METKVVGQWVKFKYNNKVETLNIAPGISVSIVKLDKGEDYEINCMGDKTIVTAGYIEMARHLAEETLKNKLQEAINNLP
jgi:hypothetical protein